MKSTLIDHLSVIAKDKEFISKIFRERFSKTAQEAKVRSLLTPMELERYNAGMKVISDLQSVHIPKPESVDLRDVKQIPEKSASAIKEYLQRNSHRLIVYGSLVDWLYAKGTQYAVRPGDIDLAMSNPEQSAKDIEKIINETSDVKTKIHKSKRFDNSFKVEVYRNDDWHTAVDIHPMSMYRDKMPYNWKHDDPVIVDGIKFSTLEEQLLKRGIQVLNPGVGIEGRGQIGPKAAQREWREKDISRMEAVVKLMIREARKQGKNKIADEASKNLDVLMREPVKPYPTVIPPEPISKSSKQKHKLHSIIGTIR